MRDARFGSSELGLLQIDCVRIDFVPFAILCLMANILRQEQLCSVCNSLSHGKYITSGTTLFRLQFFVSWQIYYVRNDFVPFAILCLMANILRQERLCSVCNSLSHGKGECIRKSLQTFLSLRSKKH